jgi:ABC-type polysaccharide/polyol phosphate transport system ATPase subunit
MSSLTVSDLNQHSGIPISTVIRLEDVSVRYRVPNERVNTFKEYIIRRIQGKFANIDFWALHHVNLDVSQGEVFGIVGRNGAGKSTLLKLIARILRPTTGRVWVQGLVVPLLELGAGFHPELTGRENLFLNGAMLGFSHAEMEEKIPRIVKFSGLEEFIDAPLRTYSSGMYARLGFALATDSPPEVLIVDEILGVGDEEFQNKCAARISSFRERGTTILMVSHNANLIGTMCQRVAWLDHGKVMAVGGTDEVLRSYHESQK